VIQRRIYLNLAAFAALFLVLCWWAVNNLVTVDSIEKPFRVTAFFEEAPGLRANVEVTYLGVRVGRIRSVDLEDGTAKVELALHRGTEVPVGLSAAVRRKSAVGEPYVALEAPTSWRPGDGYVPDDGSYVIPVEETTTPSSYGELFSSVSGLLTAVDPDDLGTTLGELSAALAGRGDELRSLFSRGADLTTTLAARSDELDRLATELTALTGTIADKSGTIGSGTDDLATLVGSLSASADDLDALLTRAPRLGQQVNDLLAASALDVACGLDHAAEISSVLARPHGLTQLVRLLFAAQTARVVLPKATIQGPDGPYLAGTFGFAPGSGNTTYDHFIELPEPPPIEDCPTGSVGTGSAVGPSSLPGGPGGPPRSSGEDGGDHRPGAEPAADPESTNARSDGHDFQFGALLAAVAALLLASLAASTRPWQRWTGSGCGHGLSAQPTDSSDGSPTESAAATVGTAGVEGSDDG
jgi:phospholipid/cholesterol/gamma-HCH transport system substrate-binding protein